MKIFYKLLISFMLIVLIRSLNDKAIKLTYDDELGFYTVDIKLGSTSQEFYVQVDTTTSETWVPSTNTSVDVPQFDITQSTTVIRTNKTFEVEDEDGDVRGKATYDTLTIGNFTLENMGFVLVDEFEYGFKDYFQGKLGLGFKQEHGLDFNFIGLLKEKELIDYDMFSIVPDTKELIIGNKPEQFADAEYTTCSLTETNDLDDDYRAGWVCELSHVYLGTPQISPNDLESHLEVSARVVFDSAYPYISMPKRHLKGFKDTFINPIYQNTCKEKREDDATFFVCENEYLVKKSSMGFVIEGYTYTLPWDRIFVENDDGKFELLVRFYVENDDIFSFGSPFCDYYTLVYDFDEEEVGFYGGERIDITQEYDDYLNDLTPTKKKQRTQKLLWACGFGVLLLIIIIIVVIRAKREGERVIGPRSANRLEQID